MGSVHNELTGRSGFVSRAIRNALQIESGEVGIERVSETLQPNINLWSRPEWAILRGERLWAVAPSQPAVAAEFSQVGIFNPAASGLIVVVDAVMGVANTTATVQEFMLGANVAFTATGTPNSRDSRTALLVGIQCGSFAHHAGARIGSGALIASIGHNNGTYAYWPLNVVLHPGFFLAGGPSVVNTLAAISFFGSERPAFAGELNARA